MKASKTLKINASYLSYHYDFAPTVSVSSSAAVGMCSPSARYGNLAHGPDEAIERSLIGAAHWSDHVGRFHNFLLQVIVIVIVVVIGISVVVSGKEIS
jgi:hypothetical protein